MVGDSTVDLLRHRAVVATQSGLDVGERQAKLRGRQRPGERRVSIAKDDDPVWRLSDQYRFQLLEHLPGLLAMRAGADAQMVIGLRQIEFLEENVGERRVVVLARVHQHLIAPASQLSTEGGSLDELGAGADDGDDFHER